MGDQPRGDSGRDRWRPEHRPCRAGCRKRPDRRASRRRHPGRQAGRAGHRCGHRHRSRAGRGTAAVAHRVDRTIDAWGRWSDLVGTRAPGPMRRPAQHSREDLPYEPGWAIAAPATTSLPEAIGGPKNYDYRYPWIRDSSFTLNAFIRLGLREEVHAAVSWPLDAVSRADIHVFYSLNGRVASARARHWGAPGTARRTPGLFFLPLSRSRRGDGKEQSPVRGRAGAARAPVAGLVHGCYLGLADRLNCGWWPLLVPIRCRSNHMWRDFPARGCEIVHGPAARAR